MPDTIPLVSIILPTYNGSRYLAGAIESCCAQTYSHWELIIVDDGSQDATPQIIAKHAARDARIRSMRHEKNQRIPAALNTGHAAARGQYLVWTSDDNRFLPTAIEEMAHFLEVHPRIGLVYADCVIIDEHGKYIGDAPAQPAHRLAYWNAVSACFMYRRSVYEAVGAYDASLFLAEDYDYWLRVYRMFEMAPLHKVLYEYRDHAKSLTSTSKQSAIWHSAELALRRHLPHLHRSERRDRARGWIFCATTAARRGDPLSAAGAYIRALCTAPGFAVGYATRKLVDRISNASFPRRRNPES